jgi:hypothetical protein
VDVYHGSAHFHTKYCSTCVRVSNHFPTVCVDLEVCLYITNALELSFHMLIKVKHIVLLFTKGS